MNRTALAATSFVLVASSSFAVQQTEDLQPLASRHQSVSGADSFIGGGRRNRASGDRSVVTGGYGNVASGYGAVVSGGQLNKAGDRGAVVSGGAFNEVEPGYGPGYAVIAGGAHNRTVGQYCTVGGGRLNLAEYYGATVSGGAQNEAFTYGTIGGGVLNRANHNGTVGGGALNDATGFSGCTVGGGARNKTSIDGATGSYSTIGGGQSNIATGYGSTVPGGATNRAMGDNSFAAGKNAHALHDGAFVWADEASSVRASSADNEFSVFAGGGARIFSSSDGSAGVSLAPGGGSWTTVSDRNAKENFEPVDGRSVLECLASIPISTWNYRAQDDSVRHMGPMAQDFHAAFGLGLGDTSIDTVDPDGVALAAIQALNEKLERLEATVADRDAENAELRTRVAQLEELEVELDRLETTLAARAGAE